MGKTDLQASPQSERPLNNAERVEHRRAVRTLREYRKQPSRLKARAAASSARPGVVTGLKVSATTTGSVSLDWAAAKGITPVRFTTSRGGISAASTTYSHSTVSGLACGQTYQFKVIAVSAAGRQSNAASVTGTTAKCPVAAAVAPRPSTTTTTAATPPTTTTPTIPPTTPPVTTTPPTTPSTNTFAQLRTADMAQASEALPHGITYDFAYHPRLSAGLNAGGYTAFTGWGQLYECASGNPQPAARVEIRDIQSWIKSKSTGAWRVVQQSTATDGGAYSESFVNNTSKTSDAVTLSSGSTSVTAGGGYNYHFWPKTSRVSIDPNDVAGVITNARYRLVPGTYDPTKPSPCYVLSMGADYWSAVNAQWNQLLTNRDVGIGRFKRVDSDWRTGTMSTAVGAEVVTPAGSTAGEYR